ncbi:MAG: hypothetical protein MZV65_47980 [Chromatiales bacterium]|nr:hypothetical protein [Chromatiales bacterium]
METLRKRFEEALAKLQASRGSAPPAGSRAWACSAAPVPLPAALVHLHRRRPARARPRR